MANNSQDHLTDLLALAKLTLWIGVLEFIGEWLTLALRQGLHESQGLQILDQAFYMFKRSTHVLTTDGLDDIVWRRAQQLRDDGKLVDMVLAGEKGLPLKHLREDAPSAPDIHLHIVLLPGEHDLGGSVVPRGDVASHLGVLNTG